MADDLDKLVITHLREIHAELQGIGGKLEDHGRRLHKLDARLDGFSLATLNRLNLGKLETHQGATEAWRQSMEARLDQIERRLEKVEQKLNL